MQYVAGYNFIATACLRDNLKFLSAELFSFENTGKKIADKARISFYS